MSAERFLDIGIVGGMSPESTVAYYQRIVRRHEAEFGDHSYPRVVIASVSFEQYIGWQHAGEWARIAAGLTRECRAVAAAGAAFALIAANTMHKVLPQVDSPVPVLSILDAAARHARARGVRRVGLTGTRFTMSDGFYAAGLEERGLSVVLPAEAAQETIHEIIYRELIFGRASPASAESFHAIAQDLLARGADAVLLACTELALLMPPGPLPPEYIDSAQVHADAAWEVSVGRQPFI